MDSGITSSTRGFVAYFLGWGGGGGRTDTSTLSWSMCFLINSRAWGWSVGRCVACGVSCGVACCLDCCLACCIGCLFAGFWKIGCRIGDVSSTSWILVDTLGVGGIVYALPGVFGPTKGCFCWIVGFVRPWMVGSGFLLVMTTCGTSLSWILGLSNGCLPFLI